MKANYKDKTQPVPRYPFPGMTDRELKAWNLVEKYRAEEYEAVVDVIEISFLYAMASREKDRYGAVRCKQMWQDMIRARVKARAMLRRCEGGYTIEATGKNVEDFFMREELRKIGVEPWEWQKHMSINVDTGEVVFDE